MNTSMSTSTETPTVQSAGDRDPENEALLEVTDLKKYFEQSDSFIDRIIGGSGEVKAVDGVDLTLHAGETLAVVGESGCGKSTLGQTMLNLHQPTDGSIRYKGDDLAGMSEREMRPYRRDLQMIFQDPLASLNPRQKVGQILKAPMEVHGIGESDAERTDRVESLLERVGLKPGHADRYPHQFSGGQQQRIGIARALSLEPELIIADEPVSALDVSVQAQILNLLNELQEDLGLALLFIAHDLSVVRHIADRIAVMYLGTIVETAPVDELFENPRHPYTKSLLSAVPRISADDRTERIVLEGTVPSPLDPPSGCRFHTRCPAVIPPDEWSGTQQQFKIGFAFRNRVIGNDIDPEAVRTRLKGDEKDTDDDAVAARIIEQSFPEGLTDYPEESAETIRQTAEALANGNRERAIRYITDTFQSPCEQETPRDASVSKKHSAACHHVDPDAPGEPELL
jgi:peptide/nickel transport system ATP-binding protein